MKNRAMSSFLFHPGIALLILAAACSGLAGCAYHNQPANQQQLCAAPTNSKRCPDDYHCAADGFCWRNGSEPGGGGGKGGSGDLGVLAGTAGAGGTAATGGGADSAGAPGTAGMAVNDGGVRPDVAVDFAPPQDGPVTCGAGQKVCGGSCVASDDPAYGCDTITCDPSACPVVGSATLVCQGTACVIGTCGASTKKCGTNCVSLTDPIYGCGATTCDSSTCPAAGTGTLVCQGTTCVVGTCGVGTKKCGTKCVALTDPTYGCGATTCDSSTCPAAGTGTLVCQGTTCVIGTCGAGTKKCGGNCAPTDANNGCGDPTRCTACAANETCTGTPVTSCQCVPNNVAACAGKACGSATNNCGQVIPCTNTCIPPAVCNGGSAGVNGCGCTANNVAACMGKACGPAVNNCGQAIPCPDTCRAPETCNGGTAGVNGCGCAPIPMTTVCAGKCGAVANGCGTSYTCTCPTGQLCGTTGACCTPIPMATACAGKCGAVANGCGMNYTCTCPTGQVCGATGACCTPIPMATACAGKCGAVANGCGMNYTCTCPGTQVCGGNNMPGVCCTPQSKLQACAGKACGTVREICGTTIACDNACVTLANTTTTCSATNQCVRGCAAGAVPLSCSTATNPACGRWDFETNNSEGWFADGSPSAPRVNALHASSGFQSLAVVFDSLFVDGFDSQFGNSIAIEVRMCQGPIGVAGKRLSAHLFFVADDGTPVTGSTSLFASIGVYNADLGQGFSGFVEAVNVDVAGPQALLQGTIPASVASLHTNIAMFIFADGGPWAGTVYIDDVRIE
jgi:hypothetical protein